LSAGPSAGRADAVNLDELAKPSSSVTRNSAPRSSAAARREQRPVNPELPAAIAHDVRAKLGHAGLLKQLDGPAGLVLNVADQRLVRPVVVQLLLVVFQQLRLAGEVKGLIVCLDALLTSLVEPPPRRLAAPIPGELSRRPAHRLDKDQPARSEIWFSAWSA
jgi:hypothetical protein